MAEIIRPTGMSQKALVTLIRKTTSAVDELMDDHAINKTYLDEALGKLDSIIHLSQNRAYGNADPAFAINSNFDVKNTATTLFTANGVLYTLTANTNCDTGTSKTLTGSKWGAFVIDASNATTLTATWAASDYASEALALAAARALPFTTNQCRLGVVTVLAHASGFIAGTSALTTGTGGNVATTTNYYGLISKSIAALGSATTAPLLTAGQPGTVNGDEITV